MNWYQKKLKYFYGDWGLGPIPNPQSPIPNPQSPIDDILKNKIKKRKFKIKLNS